MSNLRNTIDFFLTWPRSAFNYVDSRYDVSSIFMYGFSNFTVFVRSSIFSGDQSEQTEQSLVLMLWPKDQTHLRELCYSKVSSSFSSRHSMDGKFLFVDKR